MEVKPETDLVEAPSACQPEEEELSKEEAEAMRAELLAKARGVQQLIVTLQENEAKLKDIVQDFVLREYAEQQVGASLNNRVELQQVSHLQNPHYIRWAVANKKGEYDEQQGLLSEEEYLESQFSKELESPVSWLTVVPENHRPLHAASLMDSVVPMLCQWRESTKYHLLITEGFCLRFGKHLLQDRAQPTPIIYLVNGEPLLDNSILREILQGSTELEAQKATGELVRGLAPVLQKFRKEWKDAVGVNSQFELYRDLLLLFASRFDLFTTLTASCPALPEILIPEGNVICAVPLNFFRESVLVRVFIFQGKIVALENLEPDLLDSLAFLSLSERDVRDRIGSFVHDTTFTDKRSVLTILLSKQSLCLVDKREFSPDLPFKWKFSFTDLCGIGSAAANQDTIEPVYRRTTIEAARLKPFDDLSTLLIEAMQAESTQPSTSPPKVVETRGLSGVTLLALCGALAIGVVASVLRNQRK